MVLGCRDDLPCFSSAKMIRGTQDHVHKFEDLFLRVAAAIFHT